MEKELARIIVNHSLKVIENDKVLITYEGKSKSLVKYLIDEINNIKFGNKIFEIKLVRLDDIKSDL